MSYATQETEQAADRDMIKKVIDVSILLVCFYLIYLIDRLFEKLEKPRKAKV